MKISEFKKAINWRIFYKTMAVLSSIILFSISQPNSILNWFEGFLFILVIALLLLSNAYIELKIKEAPKALTIKDIRRKKLKKINRWRFLKI